jgi:peptidoglycan/xylan/chitin deacetylase (PgdA/CDA1 family)
MYYSGLVWKMEPDAVYLTFDDGPHPQATPYVLQQLEAYDAKATFFCIGKNVAGYPAVYGSIISGGHTVGNHTYNHLNGWKTDTGIYIKNVVQADAFINSKLFRPPYGRLTKAQSHMLREAGRTIYMWDVLSGDFDVELSPEQCLQNVLKHIKPGSIVVFHDSDKAWERMRYALPRVLQYCKEKNWQMKALPQE